MIEVAAQQEFGGFTLDISFSAPVPGVTVLFGPSGSGKSTVLSIIAGLRKPRSGRIVLDGAVVLDTASRIEIPAERRRCGVVFQDARLLPHLSVETNLRYGARRAPAHASGPGFSDVVDMLGVAALLRRRPLALSGGERQRVALGRALLSRPRILLMDEPLAALDGPRKAEILPFLEQLRDNGALPIVYVTHSMSEADRLADTLVLIEDGRVTAAGPMHELAARTDLRILSSRRDAGAVLPCVIEANDAARGLTRLSFPGGELLVPLRNEPVGARIRLRLLARDISIAPEFTGRISSHNILPVTIRTIEPIGLHDVFVTLLAGPTTLLARLTRDAVSELGLAPGVAVFALVKATSFDRE